MGYMYYEVTRQDGVTIEAGYGVPAVCEKDGCDEEINRGLGCLCGEVPGGDEYGCGRYFCGWHLYGAPADEPGGRCADCRDQRR
ncbi:hypothetical protein ACH4FX_12255 [Streptomyces sp. NPDC018019]|uniref:hypothetical protein n=1 Tax=Streptomyces sp. NPDC018019 TaxID=3365030 RepID=UPI0037A33E42